MSDSKFSIAPYIYTHSSSSRSRDNFRTRLCVTDTESRVAASIIHNPQSEDADLQDRVQPRQSWDLARESPQVFIWKPPPRFIYFTPPSLPPSLSSICSNIYHVWSILLSLSLSYFIFNFPSLCLLSLSICLPVSRLHKFHLRLLNQDTRFFFADLVSKFIRLTISSPCDGSLAGIENCIEKDKFPIIFQSASLINYTSREILRQQFNISWLIVPETHNSVALRQIGFFNNSIIRIRI